MKLIQDLKSKFISDHVEWWCLRLDIKEFESTPKQDFDQNDNGFHTESEHSSDLDSTDLNTSDPDTEPSLDMQCNFSLIALLESILMFGKGIF